MIHAVRCPRCQNFARVGEDALGRTVACPSCGHLSAAAADPSIAPGRDGPRRNPTLPTLARPNDAIPTVPRYDHTRFDEPADGTLVRRSPPGVIGLALLPLGIPLAWLVVPLAGGREPIFSFAAPVALAAGLVGLGLGVGYAANWSAGTRVRGVLALVLVGYTVAGFLLFMKKEWAVAIRRHLPDSREFRVFTEPKRAYRVSVPGVPQELPASPLPGWPLKAYRVTDGVDKNPAVRDTYEFAHGKAADAVKLRTVDDADWFALAKQALTEATGGTVRTETEFKQDEKDEYPGREYVLDLPDGSTGRVVRVIRANKTRAFYLAVEGTFLSVDRPGVKKFFSSFVIDPAK